MANVTLDRMLDEQRAAPREPLALTIKLDGGAGGVTRNVSASGLSVRLPAHHRLGEYVHFELHLAGAHLTFVTEGKVVRREHRHGELLVAIKFLSARLFRSD